MHGHVRFYVITMDAIQTKIKGVRLSFEMNIMLTIESNYDSF